MGPSTPELPILFLSPLLSLLLASFIIFFISGSISNLCCLISKTFRLSRNTFLHIFTCLSYGPGLNLLPQSRHSICSLGPSAYSVGTSGSAFLGGDGSLRSLFVVLKTSSSLPPDILPLL